MDAPRQNAPSRKSRFRAHGPSMHRPADPVDGPVEESAEYAEPDPATYSAEGPAGYNAEPPSMEETASAEAGVPHDLEAGEIGAGSYEGTGYAAPAEDPYAAPPQGSYAAPADQLPAGLRLTRSTERISGGSRKLATWVLVSGCASCLAIGGAIGYFLHGTPARVNVLGETSGRAAEPAPTLPLDPAVLADVDAGFELVKHGEFSTAREHFNRLADKNPDWTSMRIEAARAALYEHDFDGAEKILNAILRVKGNVDAEFLTGLLQMTRQGYDKSEAAFARAVALDPSRPDIFYFWGECLRREGKPQDAAEKFREALIRNQYETTEGLYQLKLWLSEIQADHEGAGSNEKIDADLNSGHPSGPALFAAAARDLKAGRYRDAGAHVGQAQKAMEPAVFRVVLQDPLFLEENFRPELAPFYKP